MGLLPRRAAAWFTFKITSNDVKNAKVQDCHQCQRNEIAEEETDVDQVGHGDDGYELAENSGVFCVSQSFMIVPSKHGGKAEWKCEKPASSNHQPGVSPSHCLLVPIKNRYMFYLRKMLKYSCSKVLAKCKNIWHTDFVNYVRLLFVKN